MRRLFLLCALAGCSESQHEPVRLIAAPARQAAPADLPAPQEPVRERLRAASPASATAPVDPVLVGRIVGPNAPRMVGPSEPNGNETFRRAIESRNTTVQGGGD
jgi:hypothetical protein